jgi:hypothetical protein
LSTGQAEQILVWDVFDGDDHENRAARLGQPPEDGGRADLFPQITAEADPEMSHRPQLCCLAGHRDEDALLSLKPFPDGVQHVQLQLVAWIHADPNIEWLWLPDVFLIGARLGA